MGNWGYGFVSDKGFSAFAKDLSEGSWKDISIQVYDVADHMPQQLIFEAPRPVVWKLWATWSIRSLDDALGYPAALAAERDVEWDSAQRALNLCLATAAEHKDPAVRDAAVRLRGVLLKGAGAEQTILGHQAEVDYGRQQVLRVAKEPLSADAALIPGLADHMTRIDAATEALGEALGRSPGADAKRAIAPSKRLREAMSACVTAFNSIHDEIEWTMLHTPPGAVRDQLVALHAPFLSLLERYPPPAKSTPEAPPPPAPVAKKSDEETGGGGGGGGTPEGSGTPT